MSLGLRDMVRDAADFLVPRAVPGTDLTRSHSWPWPPSVTVLLLALAAGLVILLYLREHGTASGRIKLILAGLRIALIALVVFMMHGWLLHRHRTDLPELVVMIDDSQSMGVEDAYDDSVVREHLLRRLDGLGWDSLSRLNLAKLWFLEDDARRLRELASRYNIKLVRLGSSARVWGPPRDPAGEPRTEELAAAIAAIRADEPSSRLGSGLRDVLESQRGRPTAAVLLMTDGITTEGRTLSEVAEYARRKTVPLLLVGLGDQQPPRDLRISDLLVDEAVFVGDLLNFDFRLTGAGYEGRQVRVELKKSGSEEAPLAEKEVTIREEGEPQSLRLSHRPSEEGDFEYVVQVEPPDDEVNLENNRQSRVVKVRDETLRVLYVQDYPNYDFRFLTNALRRALKRDGQERAFELTTVLQEADARYAQIDATAERVFPVSREELFDYDVLIFGDVNPSFLSRSVMENIVAFVEQRGGGAVFLAGPRYMPRAYRETPLAKLLPIDLETASVPARDHVWDQPIRVQPTPLISASPPLQLANTVADSLRIWRELPPLYWMLEAPDLRPGARVLAVDPARTSVRGENLPVICLQFVGAGKVVFHTTDESYRWSRHPDGEHYHSLYWTQTIRYLSRARLLEGARGAELTTDRLEYRQGDLVRLRVRFFDDRLAPEADDGVQLMLEQETGTRRQIRLHRDAGNRGIFEGLIGNLAEGEYRVWLAAPQPGGTPPSQRFTVMAPPGEMARLQMDAADMQAAAELSDGRFYTFDQADRLLQDLPPGRQVRIDSLPPQPIWNSPLAALLFVILITTEWLLRKRAGLL